VQLERAKLRQRLACSVIGSVSKQLKLVLQSGRFYAASVNTSYYQEPMLFTL